MDLKTPKLQVRFEARMHIKNPSGREQEAVLVGYRDATDEEVKQHGNSLRSSDSRRS